MVFSEEQLNKLKLIFEKFSIQYIYEYCFSLVVENESLMEYVELLKKRLDDALYREECLYSQIDAMSERIDELSGCYDGEK